MAYRALLAFLALSAFPAPAASQELTRTYPTTVPVITNKTEMRAMAAAEAARILEAGDSTVTTVRIELNAAGIPTRVFVESGTGRPSVDSAAVRVGNALRFANVHPDDVPMLIQIPIVIARSRTANR